MVFEEHMWCSDFSGFEDYPFLELLFFFDSQAHMAIAETVT